MRFQYLIREKSFPDCNALAEQFKVLIPNCFSRALIYLMLRE
jgi:hypothetical protein